MTTAVHDVVVRSYEATVFQGLNDFPIARRTWGAAATT
jgi:hypothetical protein